MVNTEKVVVDIVKSLVSKKNKSIVSKDSRLREDLGLDSMRMITLAMNLEEKAGVDLISASDELDLVSIATVDDVINLVNKIS